MTDSLTKLVRSVFESVEGKKLLQELHNHYVMSPIYNNDKNDVYYRLGKRDLIIYFEEALKEVDTKVISYSSFN
jgi:hypothetical protein